MVEKKLPFRDNGMHKNRVSFCASVLMNVNLFKMHRNAIP